MLIGRVYSFEGLDYVALLRQTLQSHKLELIHAVRAALQRGRGGLTGYSGAAVDAPEVVGFEDAGLYFTGHG